MLVGAPKANTSQPGVLQGGAVYVCPWDTSPAQCTTIQFDSKGRLEEFREGPRVSGWVGLQLEDGAWGSCCKAYSLSTRATCSPSSSSGAPFPSCGLPVALTPCSQPSPRRAGMIQKHVALISTESPTTLGGQSHNTKDRRRDLKRVLFLS